jgi:hypothetical protein
MTSLQAVQAIVPDAHALMRLLEPVTPNQDGIWAFVR